MSEEVYGQYGKVCQPPATFLSSFCFTCQVFFQLLSTISFIMFAILLSSAAHYNAVALGKLVLLACCLIFVY